MKTYDQITCKRLLDRFEDLSKKLYSANAEITVLRNLKNVTDENYGKLLGERGELQDKLKIAEQEIEKIANLDFVISLPDRMDSVREIARNALKKIRGEA